MNNKNYYCIIMAGGMGRRFWPYSRKQLPKQFLDFFGTGQTLLRMSYDRCKGLILPENIYITTHVDYKDIVKQILPEIDDKHLILEEERRNTAPSLAYASHLIQTENPNATIVVAPSDQLILNMDNFRESIRKGLDFASTSGKLINVGIKPTRPETGYGYIQIDEEREGENGEFCKVKTFIEKPALEFAEVFVSSNEFYWNSGIFIWHVDTIMNAFHENMTDVCPRLECETPDFSACPNISIDYSIMEKADNVYVQICDFGWADIGTWQSLYDATPKDVNHNVIMNSNSLLYDCNDNIILMPKDKLIVAQGLDGYIIAEHDNVLLICKKEEQNSIRKFVNDAEMKFGEKYI